MAYFFSPPDDPSLKRLDPLSSEAFNALRQASALRHRLMVAILPPEQTHPAQVGYLLALEQNDGLSQTDLALTLHVSRPSVTAMLQKLEATGLVERKTDEHDQRITRIFITDEGRALAASLHEAHTEAIASTIGRMSEDDRRELVRLLNVLNETTLTALAERGARP